MKTVNISFNPLNIDNCVWFLGSDEDRERAEALEQKRRDELEEIIFSNGFRAMRYVNSWGQRRILHRSTRRGVAFQLSYIDADGIPAMHENYIMTSADHVDEAIADKRALLMHFVHESNHDVLSLEVLEG